MKRQYGRAAFIGYSLFLIVISALMTVLFYHVFIFKTFSPSDESGRVTFTELSVEQAAGSPIKDVKSIVEVMSYGCHYCAANEGNIAKLVQDLPEGVSFSAIHLAKAGSPLASFASVFATLEEMGIEKQKRGIVYKSVIENGVNLADSSVLETWLKENGISVEQYNIARQSQAVKARMEYMEAVTDYYNIRSTPIFIINQRYIMTQDESFPEFAKKMMHYVQKDEQNP